MKSSCAARWNWPALAGAREEVPVGAVLVRDGAILTEGSNEVETRQDATAHAEMLAIAEAQALLKTWRLNGTTLYVTRNRARCAPGRWPTSASTASSSASAIPRQARVGGAFQLFDLPGLNHRCEITPGVLRDESLILLQDFFRERRAGQL